MAMALDKVLSMVRKLVERAEHPETEEAEARACRQRADDLMLKYRIEDAELPAARRSRPGKIIIDMCPLGSPFKDELMHLATVIADYTRCDYVMHGFRYKMSKSMRDYYDETGRSPGSVKLTVYGFESDLKYFELLWTVLNLHLANGLDIDYDYSKSMEENCYIMHNAGYNWLNIARAYGWEKVRQGWPGVKEPWRLREAHDGIPAGTIQPATMVGSRFKRAYYRHIGVLGEARLSIPASSRIVFQINFMRSYWIRVQQRLREAAARRAGGAELVLASSFQEVKDMLKEENKDVKPAKTKDHGYNEEGWRRGKAHADTADLDGSKVGGRNAKEVR